MQALAINYHSVISETQKAVQISFSIAKANNMSIVHKHCGDNKQLYRYLQSYQFKLWIPRSVFHFSSDKKTIVLHHWFFERIQDTPFMSESDSILFNINRPLFKQIVKHYLCKNY